MKSLSQLRKPNTFKIKRREVTKSKIGFASTKSYKDAITRMYHQETLDIESFVKNVEERLILEGKLIKS